MLVRPTLEELPRPIPDGADRADLCRICAAHWPCQPARLALLIEYEHDRIALAIYLAVAMHEAIHDHARLGNKPDLTTLHDRFLGWVTVDRRRPSSGST